MLRSTILSPNTLSTLENLKIQSQQALTLRVFHVWSKFLLKLISCSLNDNLLYASSRFWWKWVFSRNNIQNRKKHAHVFVNYYHSFSFSQSITTRQIDILLLVLGSLWTILKMWMKKITINFVSRKYYGKFHFIQRFSSVQDCCLISKIECWKVSRVFIV